MLNIVEIGRPFVKYAIPETRCFASVSTASLPGTKFESFWSLGRALRDPQLDLVVCHPQYKAPWNLQWWLRHIGHRNILRGYMPLASLFAPQFLRFSNRCRVAIVDLEDCRFIEKCDRFLLDRCDVWFKRELPLDSWQAFMRTFHPSVPTLRYRNHPKNRKRVAKLKPLPLGHKLGIENELPTSPVRKTSDVFWAGTCKGSSSVRESGLRQLIRLRATGFSVDIAESPISRTEYLARAAAAYLVWSPEGYGWDCFRHYEAPMCWSVPVINYPTIQRHKPLVDGKHAFYYNVEDDDLLQKMTSALSDRSRLISMAHEARQHVIDHHSLSSVVSYIIRTTCESNSPFGRVARYTRGAG